MTNTKFRKRALLSSVAMLLVALVALGSATFAWFVANPTANAEGLKMTTQATAGIYVASASVIGKKTADESYVDAFKKTTYLNAVGNSIAAAAADTNAWTSSLDPASPYLTPGNGGQLTFGTIDADEANAKTLDPAGTWSENPTVYTEKVYIKTSTQGSSDQATVQSVKVDITTNSATAVTAKNGVKVAITSSDGKLLGIWKPNDNGADNTKTYAGDSTAVGAAGLTDTAWNGYKTSGAWASLAAADQITVGSAADPATAKYINVYVYLDGENTGVFSDNVPDITTLLTKVDVSVSTAANS